MTKRPEGVILNRAERDALRAEGRKLNITPDPIAKFWWIPVVLVVAVAAISVFESQT